MTFKDSSLLNLRALSKNLLPCKRYQALKTGSVSKCWPFLCPNKILRNVLVQSLCVNLSRWWLAFSLSSSVLITQNILGAILFHVFLEGLSRCYKGLHNGRLRKWFLLKLMSFDIHWERTGWSQDWEQQSKWPEQRSRLK